MLFLRWQLAVSGLLICFGKSASAQCNPLMGVCGPIPGQNTSVYFVDFTQQSGLPLYWIQANFETVNYSSTYGAEFSLSKQGDAPYIWTSSYFLFGQVDVVMQAAPGTGVSSSVVLMSDDLDEIDWEFSGNNFGLSGGRVHTNYFGKGITGNYDRGTQPSVSDPTKAFHTYSLDWSSSELVWSIDGTIIRTLPYSPATSGNYQYPQTPMRLHLGLWDGGNPNVTQGVVQWAGGYTDLTKLPYTAYVKSVKITSSSSCSSYIYGDLSGTYKSIECKNITTPDASSSPSSASSSGTTASFPVASSATSAAVVVPTMSKSAITTSRSMSASSSLSTSLVVATLPVSVSTPIGANLSFSKVSSPIQILSTLTSSGTFKPRTSNISDFTSFSLSTITSSIATKLGDIVTSTGEFMLTTMSSSSFSTATTISSSASATSTESAKASEPAPIPPATEAPSIHPTGILISSPVMPKPFPTITPKICNQDNCLRNMLDSSYCSKQCSSSSGLPDWWMSE